MQPGGQAGHMEAPTGTGARSPLCVGFALRWTSVKTGTEGAPTSMEPALAFPVPGNHSLTLRTYILSSVWSPSMPEMNWGKEKALSMKIFQEAASEYRSFHLI